MKRTATTVVVLAGSARPKAHATLLEATDSLDRLAHGAPRIGDVRFVGYDKAAVRPDVRAQIPAACRVAVYQADYDITD